MMKSLALTSSPIANSVVLIVCSTINLESCSVFNLVEFTTYSSFKCTKLSLFQQQRKSFDYFQGSLLFNAHRLCIIDTAKSNLIFNLSENFIRTEYFLNILVGIKSCWCFYKRKKKYMCTSKSARSVNSKRTSLMSLHPNKIKSKHWKEECQHHRLNGLLCWVLNVQ